MTKKEFIKKLSQMKKAKDEARDYCALKKDVERYARFTAEYFLIEDIIEMAEGLE